MSLKNSDDSDDGVRASAEWSHVLWVLYTCSHGIECCVFGAIFILILEMRDRWAGDLIGRRVGAASPAASPFSHLGP